MFSQVTVCSQGDGGFNFPACHWCREIIQVASNASWDMSHGWVPGIPTPCCTYPPDTCIPLRYIPPMVLTPSSGHQITYGWQAGGTHPIGMHFCSYRFSQWIPKCVKEYVAHYRNHKSLKWLSIFSNNSLHISSTLRDFRYALWIIWYVSMTKVDTLGSAYNPKKMEITRIHSSSMRFAHSLL